MEYQKKSVENKKKFSTKENSLDGPPSSIENKNLELFVETMRKKAIKFVKGKICLQAKAKRKKNRQS